MMEKTGSKLAKKAAALLCAVLLFTSSADIFMPFAEVIAADDAIPVSGTFSISAAQIQYGEDGSNESGNLDRLFKPALIIDGSELVLGSDYSVRYKFFTDKGSAQVTDADAFDAAEGMILSEIPAGTEICVLACAETSDAGYPASAGVINGSAFSACGTVWESGLCTF